MDARCRSSKFISDETQEVGFAMEERNTKIKRSGKSTILAKRSSKSKHFGDEGPITNL